MFCTIDDLQTESDVEQKLLWHVLSEAAPVGFGYAPSEIRTKNSLKRLEIGKGTSKKVYFPDYVILIEGVPLVVVEAKAPGESLEGGLEEARLYAAKVNEFFPSGINPCEYVLASDGRALQVGRWDCAEAAHNISIEEISVTSPSYARVVETLARERTSQLAKKFRRTQSSHPLYRPISRIGGTSARNEQIGHNTFGSTLALDFRTIFTPVTPHDRARLVRNAYVGSKRRERYVEPIERLISDAAIPFVQHVPVFENTETPRELLKTLDRGASLEHQLLLLVGSVGSGKSTFVDYLVNVALPPELLSKTVWLRINLNLAPNEGKQTWMLEQLIRELQASQPETDFDELDVLLALYGGEIGRLKKGPLKLLNLDSSEYAVRLTDELVALQKDLKTTANAYSRYLCGERGKLMVLVLDNCDKRTRDEQLAIFQLAQWVQSELRCLTVLPLRDVTYDLHRNEPPLDAAQKDLVFRIEPPAFTRVLSARVNLALKDLESRGERMLAYMLPNGVRVSYPASDQGMYLATILRSLYEHDRFLRRLLTGLAGRNIRRALEIFLDFCQSGYISEAHIFQIRKLQGNYVLPLDVVASVLLRMHRRFYDGDTSYVKNLFQAKPEDDTPDHLVRLAILSCLSAVRGQKGPSGVKGYHRTDRVVDCLAAHGHSVQRIEEELLYLVRAGCVNVEHQRTDHLELFDLIALAPAGQVHLEMLDSLHYLAACAEDTWIPDKQLADRIAQRIGRSRMAHVQKRTVYDNAREFVEFLKRAIESRPSEASALLDLEPNFVVHDISPAIHAIDQANSTNTSLQNEGRLFVGSLPYGISEHDLQQLFSSAGFELSDLYLPKNEVGNGKGYAFVSLAEPKDGKRAVSQLQGKLIGGRRIRVDFAEARGAG